MRYCERDVEVAGVEQFLLPRLEPSFPPVLASRIIDVRLSPAAVIADMKLPTLVEMYKAPASPSTVTTEARFCAGT